MAWKILTIINGVKQLVEAITSSAGAGDSGKIPALGADGKLSNTFMPSGVSANVESIETTENLSAGELVNIYNSSGRKARKADGGTNKYRANGFVLAATTSGQNATVYFSGATITGLTGLTDGAPYYLSTTAGGVVPAASAPSGSGELYQYIGDASGDTAIEFNPDDGIEIV